MRGDGVQNLYILITRPSPIIERLCPEKSGKLYQLTFLADTKFGCGQS